MIPLTTLWLPILLSAVAVFIASNILWMAVPFWHSKDYGKLPEETRVVEALKGTKSGQYLVPRLDWKKVSSEQRADFKKGPFGYLLLRNPATLSFPTALISYFVYTLVISILVAYIAATTRQPGAPYVEVFRIAGTAGILGYSFGTISDSIWYGKPWVVTVKQIVDGVIYGVLVGAIFGWLWPR